MTTAKLKLAASALLLLSTLAGPALAVDYWVTRYDDPAPNGCPATDCSLREAVIAASASSNSDTIYLSAGRYELSRAGVDENAGLTGDLDVRGDVEILGPGASMTIIDANGIDRVLDFTEFVGVDSPRIEGIAITGGLSDGGDTAGIAVEPSLDLEIDRCEIYGNDNGTNNFGAILIGIGTTLTVRDSTFRDNIGGGINSNQGSAQLFNVTFSNNEGAEITGANDAAIYCNHCTIRDSETFQEIDLFGNATLQLANSAIIGNCSLVSGGTITSFGGNIESPGAGCDLDHVTDQDGVASHGFGTLADNGGPTRTFLPSVTSPAVSGANDAFCPPTDQRGATRPDTNCDVGAVERVTVRPPTPILADGFEQRNGGAWTLYVP